MSGVKFSAGYCVGTAANGNDWAWARSNKKLTVNGKKVSMFYALEVINLDSSIKQVVRETFLDKSEAIAYCAERCKTRYT